jgi:hypothetical protein
LRPIKKVRDVRQAPGEALTRKGRKELPQSTRRAILEMEFFRFSLCSLRIFFAMFAVKSFT